MYRYILPTQFIKCKVTTHMAGCSMNAISKQSSVRSNVVSYRLTSTMIRLRNLCYRVSRSIAVTVGNASMYVQ